MPEQITHDLEQYQLFVDSKAKEGSSDILPNAGENHAAIAISKLFDETKEFIKMVVGDFDGRVCDQKNYLESLEKCIDKNVSIDIITLRSPNTESLAYQLLLRKQKENKKVSIKSASKHFKSKMIHEGQEKHFSVFDKNKFRFEKDTEKHLALFSFNDTINTRFLSNLFDIEFNSI